MSTKTLGISGLALSSNQILNEPKSNLSGSEAVITYRKMSHDNPTIGAMIHAITTLCLQAQLEVVASEDDFDERNADFLRKNLDNLKHPFTTVIANALSAVIYGWNVQEIIYERRDGKIFLNSIQNRDQSTLYGWKADNDTVTHMIQQHPTTFQKIDLPLDKCLHFTIGDTTNPEGRSLLRNSYYSYFFINNLERIELISIERAGVSVPMVGIPPQLLQADASDEDKMLLHAIRAMAEGIRTDEQSVIMYPLSFDEENNPIFKIEPYPTISGGPDIDKVIRRHSINMLQSLLADWIALGTGASGSYSLSSDKTSIFAMSINSVLKNIETTLNKQLVEKLFLLNGISKALPKLIFSDVEKQDIAALGTFLNQMASAGLITPDPETEQHIRNIAGLPNTKDDF